MVWKAALLGLGAGLIGGLFGVGGGSLIVPGLVLLLAFQQKHASATSLVAIVGLAAAAAIRFGLDGKIEYDTAGILFAGAAIGALVGSRIADVVSNKALTWAFVALLVVASLRLLLTASSTTNSIASGAAELALQLGVGLGAGMLSATMGIGGGIVYVPALVTLFGFSQTTGQGTSLAVIVPTAALGAGLHARAGRVNWRIGLPLTVGGVVGALVGAEIALGVSESVLRRSFGVFLLMVALRMSKRATVVKD